MQNDGGPTKYMNHQPQYNSNADLNSNGRSAPKFILIDHSLCGVGGHHFEYASHLLREADSAGYEIVLATHRKFNDFDQVPTHWKVMPVFQFRTYTKYAIICSLNRKHETRQVSQTEEFTDKRTLEPIWNPAGWYEYGKARYRESRCQRRIKSFQAACTRLFSDIKTRPDDIVMVPTLSELDLSGLTEFMAATQASSVPTWHLQFHFDFVGGRDRTTAYQSSRCQEMRGRFQTDLAKVPRHRIVFHCTTDILAAQYQQLGVGEFQELPYPIDPRCHAPDRKRDRNHRLRITCAGGLRNEKGKNHLPDLIRDVWQPIFANGKAQLQIQAPRQQFQKLISDIDGCKSLNGTLADSTDSPIVRVEHPLDGDSYLKMIHETDIGIFLYDGSGYYTRCSGILAEMLAAGSPVVVPAGCWLADQIAEPSYRYLDKLFDCLPPENICTGGEVASSAGGVPPGPALIVGQNEQGLTCETDVPPDHDSLLIQFQYTSDAHVAPYVRVVARQIDNQDQCVSEFTAILGRRSAFQKVATMIPLNRQAVRLRLQWNNAYQSDEIHVQNLKLAFLQSADEPERRFPLGAVGLIAADNEQFPLLLQELVTHFQHYRSTAETFSRDWIQAHLPSNTFATLIRRNQEALNKAPSLYAIADTPAPHKIRSDWKALSWR